MKPQISLQQSLSSVLSPTAQEDSLIPKSTVFKKNNALQITECPPLHHKRSNLEIIQENNSNFLKDEPDQLKDHSFISQDNSSNTGKHGTQSPNIDPQIIKKLEMPKTQKGTTCASRLQNQDCLEEIREVKDILMSDPEAQNSMEEHGPDKEYDSNKELEQRRSQLYSFRRPEHTGQEEEVEDEQDRLNRLKPVRKHGLQWPLNIYQILSWIEYVFSAGIFTALICALLEETWQIATFSVVYGLFSLILAYFDIKATITDPTDPNVYYEKSLKERGQRVINKDFDYMCQICQTNVNNRTKHCGECNRCVAEFDHHCKWLNNCIGSLNYKPFFQLVLLYEIQLVFSIGAGAYFLSLSINTYLQEDQSTLSIVRLVGSSLFILVQAIKFIGLLQLLVWHVWFIRQGITTYEYVMEQREVLELREKLKDGVLTEFQFKQKRQELLAARASNQKRKRSKIIVSTTKVQSESPQQKHFPENQMRGRNSDERSLHLMESMRQSIYQDIKVGQCPNDLPHSMKSEEEDCDGEEEMKESDCCESKNNQSNSLQIGIFGKQALANQQSNVSSSAAPFTAPSTNKVWKKEQMVSSFQDHASVENYIKKDSQNVSAYSTNQKTELLRNLRTGTVFNQDTSQQINICENQQINLPLPPKVVNIKKSSTSNNPNKTGEELTVAFTQDEKLGERFYNDFSNKNSAIFAKGQYQHAPPPGLQPFDSFAPPTQEVSPLHHNERQLARAKFQNKFSCSQTKEKETKKSLSVLIDQEQFEFEFKDSIRNNEEEDKSIVALDRRRYSKQRTLEF